MRGITIARLVELYLAWALPYYSPSEGVTIHAVLELLRRNFGGHSALRFGTGKLRELRDAMIARGWARSYINKQMHRLCAMFRWGAGNQFIPAGVYEALKTIEPLKRAHTDAPESARVQPDREADVAALRPFVSRQVFAAIELMRLSGARAGEILSLRPGDIDRSGKIWQTRLREHKTDRFGIDRKIFFGPQAQAVLRPWLLRLDDAFLFSPREAEDFRLREKTAARRTPLNQGRSATGRRSPLLGEKYTVASFRRAIARACQRATVSHWHPHQLRHTAATRIRRRFGLEEAQLVLGHSSAAVTDAVYAERDQNKILPVIIELG
ncbi:MAG: site-specific integrase [Tepidisphaeraceae bacterium]